MAYTFYDYTPIAPATDTFSDACQHLDENDLAIMDAMIAGNFGMIGWSMAVYQPAGTYPPADPAHPAEIVATREDDTNYKIKAAIAWSGDKVTSVAFSKTLNGGTSWDYMGDTTNPNGTVTYTYSSVSGYETYIIAASWS